MASNNESRGRLAMLHLADANRSLEQARDSLKSLPGTEAQTTEEFEVFEAVQEQMSRLIVVRSRAEELFTQDE